MAPTPAETAAGYRKLWASATVLPGKHAAAANIAAKIIANRAPYEAVEKKTRVPWFMVGVLHNGEKIIGSGRKTTLVPAGRGPFSTWEAAAIDALTMPPHSLDRVPAWTIERILYEIEKYNGWGYLGKCNSPYLWSWTNEYSGGKYVADHVFSRTAFDVQAGCVAILKALAELDAGVAARLAGSWPAVVDPQAPPPKRPVKVPPPPDVHPITPKPAQPASRGLFAALAAIVRAMFGRKS
jgi:lysozyme family protein